MHLASRLRRPTKLVYFVALGLLLLSAVAIGESPKTPASSNASTHPDREARSEYLRQRELWFRHGREGRGSIPAATLRLRSFQAKSKLRNSRTTFFGPDSSSTAMWTSIGPSPIVSDPTGFQSYGNVTGRVTSVVIDPNDNTGNTVYVGGAEGGLWKSTNAAASNPGSVTWTQLLDAQPSLAVGFVAVQPGNGNVILVGTGEPDNTNDSYYGIGILRSTDGGNSWTTIPAADAGAHPFQGLGFAKFAFSAASPTTVVAAVSGGDNGFSVNGVKPGFVIGPYFSLDAGATWSLATVQDGGVSIQPAWATDVVYNAKAGLFFAAILLHGFYSSPDGQNWSRLPNQPGNGLLNAVNCPASISISCPILRGALAVAPGRNEMYAWFVDLNSNDNGIFQSLDGGNTWTVLDTTGIESCGDGAGCGTSQGFYDLYVSAVSTPSGTDLYAGAVNLYKCAISTSNPSCTAPGGFINLTHVYGCGPSLATTAHVHPDQHAMDFSLQSGNYFAFFGNDGGIYRTLIGNGMVFGGVSSSTCTGLNPFDDLNGTIGSMSTINSFSQDPTDPTTLLAGLQDDGSPATNSTYNSGNGLSLNTWSATNGGDGGYNEIDPTSPNNWYTEIAPDVNIQRCTAGNTSPLGCIANFSQVVSNTTVGGDHGSFYTPYILDPQVSSIMLVGTCKIWRGNGDGSNFNALSNNFETGDTTPCP